MDVLQYYSSVMWQVRGQQVGYCAPSSTALFFSSQAAWSTTITVCWIHLTLSCLVRFAIVEVTSKASTTAEMGKKREMAEYWARRRQVMRQKRYNMGLEQWVLNKVFRDPFIILNFNYINFELPLNINPYIAVNILEASLFLTRPLSVDGLVQRMRVPILVKTLIGVICNVIQCNVM